MNILGKMEKNRRPANITKYRRPLNINIGMIIFGVIFVYILICIGIYLTTTHLVGYEVQEGSLSVDNVYRGIALRSEDIIPSTDNGYVNYFVTEGQRVAVNNLVYSIDESGELSSTLGIDDSAADNQLSDDDLKDLRENALNFQGTFSPAKFSTVYDFKNKVEGSVLKIENNMVLNTINSLSSDQLSSIKLNYASESGIIVYSTDGYETKKPSDLTADDFDETKYVKTSLISNDLISQNDPAYKVITSDDWSVVIPITADRAAELKDTTSIRVKFLKNQYTARAAASILTNADGNTYLELDFDNSMITYCTDRFLDIELITEDEAGLKIPNSSIVEKNFFLIPQDYVNNADSIDNASVLRQSFTEDGKETTEEVTTTIYNFADGEYYIDEDNLSVGDVLYKQNSTETYTVSKQASLVGVYNINKGYADFRQVQVLYSNDEYSIVKPNMQYGLSVYDYIALDASTVKENDFIYE